MSDTTWADVPELVPARMVNEFSYCPRLFYLEWVQSRFSDNADTVEGRWAHRVVDQPTGAAPLPDDGELKVARSVALSSDELGVALKADLLEGQPDGTVVPVEFKKGSPPDNPERSWEPERVQLCLAGLLLREAGYRCTHGVLYFAAARARVEIAFDDALVQRTLDLLSELRQVAESASAPPPLVDSPKCPRCSLVGLCLPDETNALAERSTRAPRRLLPAADDAQPLHVTEQGAYLGLDRGRLVVKVDKEVVASIRLLDVSEVCLHGNVQMSTQLIRHLAGREVPVTYMSYGGSFQAITHGLPARHVELRRQQALTASRGDIQVACSMVQAKIRNSRVFLRRNTRRRDEAVITSLDQLADQAAAVDTLAALLGVEGAAARMYFQAFSTMLDPPTGLPGDPFDFQGRNRRPPRDPVNCLLSFGYALLAKDLTTTTFRVGFDPYLGVYHRPRFGRPALALDLAEEFRSVIVDSVVVRLINNGEIRPSQFVVRAGGVSLTPDGRKTYLAAYEARLNTEVKHPIFGYRITYRRVLEVQARLLGAVLLGEIDSYPGFVVR
jgi:CRISPR-associated protein Cas1